MCGIVGVISKQINAINDVQQKIFQELLVADTFRGAHSTGVFSVSHLNGEVDWFKRAVPGYDFVNFKRTDRILDKVNRSVFTVGHNRHATQGLINDANAHPFQHGSIIGVHNGSTPKHNFKGGHGFEVDSDALFHSMSEVGVAETIKNISGAFALVWYDEEDESLHMIRNSERPLTLAKDPYSGEIYFASEALMLQWVLDRNMIQGAIAIDTEVGVEYVFHKDDPYNFDEIPRELWKPPVYNVPKNRDRKIHHSLSSLGLSHGEEIVAQPILFTPYGTQSNGTMECVQIVHPFMSIVCHNVQKDHFKTWEGKDIKVKLTGVTTMKDGEEALYGSTKFEPAPQPQKKALVAKTFRGPNGLVTEAAFHALIEDGCENCCTKLTIKDAPTISWFGDAPLCGDCSPQFIDRSKLQ